MIHDPGTECEGSASLWEHLEELRTVLIRSLIAVLLASTCAFFFYPEILTFLTKTIPPPREALSNGSLLVQPILLRELVNTGHETKEVELRATVIAHSEGVEKKSEKLLLPPGGKALIGAVEQSAPLALFSPQEGIIAVFKISFWLGVLFASPYWMFALLRFIRPGLKGKERNILPLFLLLSGIFIAMGLTLAFYCTIPLANEYFFIFNREIGLNLWGLAHYIDYTLLLLYAHAIAFEAGALLLTAIHFGLIPWQNLAAKRKHAILGALIIGALLTPPDVLTQILVAVPLYGFFELAIFYGRFRASILRAHAQDHSCHAHPEKGATLPPAS